MDEADGARNFNLSDDGPGFSKAIMLHLGTVLRSYYDHLLPVADASEPDAASSDEPPITEKL